MNSDSAPKKGSIFKKILLGLVAVIAVFVVVVAMRPADFRITRTGKYNAPPSAVFPYVNDMHKWQEWSPWAKLDPNVKNTFEGPAAGNGAGFSWAGNSEVGEGRMTITESKTNEVVHFKLEFLKPMQSTSDTEFVLKPDGKGTEMTWSMWGKQGFVEKAICMFMDMDKIVGGQFEQGLANLKGIVDAPSK